MKLQKSQVSTDAHFRPQFRYCGLSHHDGRFNLVIDLSDPDHNERINQYLLRHGIPPRVVEEHYPRNGQVYTADDAVDWHDNHVTFAHSQMQRYYGNSSANNTLLRKVQELYREDYEMLQSMDQVHPERWLYPPLPPL